jgi:Sec-independent protein translocase protein TatA
VFGNLDPEKLFVLLVAAVLILGPNRLPSTARRAGQLWREVSDIRSQLQRELQKSLPYREVSRRGAPGVARKFLSDLMKEPIGDATSLRRVSDTSLEHEAPSDPTDGGERQSA